MTEPTFLGNPFFLVSCADNSLPKMIFWSGLSSDTTQPSLNENEQQAHTQNPISNQPKAQAGHAVTHTPHCPQSPGKAPEPSTTNSCWQTNANISKQGEFIWYCDGPWKKILQEKRTELFKAKGTHFLRWWIYTNVNVPVFWKAIPSSTSIKLRSCCTRDVNAWFARRISEMEYELSTELSPPAVTATGGFRPSATHMCFLAQGKARVIQRIPLF